MSPAPGSTDAVRFTDAIFRNELLETVDGDIPATIFFNLVEKPLTNMHQDIYLSGFQ